MAKPQKKHSHSQESTTEPQLTGREAEEHNLAGVREQPALPDTGKARRGTGDTVTSAIRGQLRSGVLKHGCTFGSFGELGTNVDAQATPQAG